MALAGDGAILIWNDITDEGCAAFYDWHIAEHIPERVAIPGFLRGRRYRSDDLATKPAYFTLYETENEAVLTSAAYLARLNAPTEWTVRATSAFRNTQRALTGVAARFGDGCGGAIATLRLRLPDPVAGAALITRTFADLARLPQVTGGAYCRTDSTASAGRTAESATRTDIETPPDHALLIEACTEGAAWAAARQAEAALAPVLGGPAVSGIYRLEFSLARTR